MHTDSHFLIGKSHAVCEDFALHGEGFAAVSDGCSRVIGVDGKQITAHTDCGARILALQARNFAYLAGSGPRASDFPKSILRRAADVVRSLGLPEDALNATLLTLRATDLNEVVANVAGDGAFAVRRRDDGVWHTTTFNFDSAPQYLYTRFDPETPPVWTIRSYVDGEYIGCAERYNWLDWFGMRVFFDCSAFNTLVVMSDGLFSFTKDGQSVAVEKLLPRLLDFRRMKGCFVRRQLAGITKELAAEGIVHQDDFSMAAICCD